MDLVFLDVETVIDLHGAALHLHGGMPGIRDRAGLESAVAQAQAGFGGVDLHPTVFDKAAAYLYHLAKNHAFLDGNKRVAALAAVTFLAMNGYRLPPAVDDGPLYDLTIRVATGEADKRAIAASFRTWCRE